MRGAAKIEESELVRLSTSEEFRMGTMGARRGKRINLVARERHCRAFQRSHIYTRTCPHKGLPRQSQSASSEVDAAQGYALYPRTQHDQVELGTAAEVPRNAQYAHRWRNILLPLPFSVH